MKNNFAAAGLMIAGLFLAGAVQAEVGLTGGVGTTGLGLRLTVPVQTNLNARVGFGYLNYSYTGNTSDVNYDFKMKLQTLDALLDYFPMNNRFRLSGGVVYNGNRIDTVAKSNSVGTYEFGGNTYRATDVGTVKGNIDFRKAVPYLGIGWGNAVAKDNVWGVSTDFGVMFQGSPKTSLTSSDCKLSAAGCTQLRNDIAAENIKLTDEVSSFKAYPVLRVGVSRKF